MTENEKDPDQILEQSKQNKRHTAEAADPDVGDQVGDDQDDEADREIVDEIVDIYGELSRNEIPDNLTLRDKHMAALIRGLERDEQLDDLGSDLRDELDLDQLDEGDHESRGGVLRMLVRVGLRETDPELIEETEEGYRQYRDEQYSGI